MRQASTQHPGPAAPARRSDAETVRPSGRGIAGLMLCGEMYGAPYDLLAATWPSGPTGYAASPPAGAPPGTPRPAGSGRGRRGAG
ncbi:MAG: hypothetical protein ACR2MP_06740 [Streptosporangiaceae bacterium]